MGSANELNVKPLCSDCDQPTVVLELIKPRARKRSKDDMLPKPSINKDVLETLKKTNRNLVSLVCHRNDIARFENEEWLLAGDGDVSAHTYYLVRDCIYSIVRVEIC